MSWQVFPLLISHADNHISLPRLWFSLHKTQIQSIRACPQPDKSLSNTALFNSEWQEKNHYMPDNFSCQKGHLCVYETTLRWSWSWFRKSWQHLAYKPVTQNSIHRMKNE
jgi:hypothetical protein